MINGNTIRLKKRSRSHKHDINRPRSRRGHKCTKDKMCLNIIVVICINITQATFEAQSMKKLSNTEAELEKSVAYKKSMWKLLTNVRSSPS